MARPNLLTMCLNSQWPRVMIRMTLTFKNCYSHVLKGAFWTSLRYICMFWRFLFESRLQTAVFLTKDVRSCSQCMQLKAFGTSEPDGDDHSHSYTVCVLVRACLCVCAAFRAELSRTTVDFRWGPESRGRPRGAAVLGAALHWSALVRQGEPWPGALHHRGTSVATLRHAGLLQHSQERYFTNC